MEGKKNSSKLTDEKSSKNTLKTIKKMTHTTWR
jgi:hypothetical protein